MRCLFLIYLFIVSIAEAVVVPRALMPDFAADPPEDGKCDFKHLFAKCPAILGSHATSKGFPKIKIFYFSHVTWIRDNIYEYMVDLELEQNVKINELVDVSLHGVKGVKDGVLNFMHHDKDAKHYMGIIGDETRKRFRFTFESAADTYAGLHCSSPFQLVMNTTKFKATYLNGCGTFGSFDAPPVCWPMTCGARSDKK